MRTLFISLALLIAISALAVEPGLEAPPDFEAAWVLPGFPVWPNGMTMDSQNRLYVANGWNDLILKFDSEGNSLGTIGTSGSGNGQLSGPTGIASDGTALYVADQGNHRVQKLSASGSFLAAWGNSGSGNGEFLFLVDLEVAPNGDVFTIDRDTYRVQRFTSQGSYVLGWGSKGSGQGQFSFPGGIAIDASEDVYVSDSGNFRVQKFDASGQLLRQWSAQATGIDVDGAGNVFVVDRTNARMQQFTTSGTPVTVWGSQGPQDGQFETIGDVATSSGGDIFVSDNSPRVQRFGYSTPVLPTTWGGIKSRYPH